MKTWWKGLPEWAQSLIIFPLVVPPVLVGVIEMAMYMMRH